MSISDHRVLTFDVVGTLIDFETGILTYIRPLAARAGYRGDDRALLAAFGRAEGVQQRETPEMPFTQMLAPIYRRLAGELGIPVTGEDVSGLTASIADWPAFPDAVAALRRLGSRFRLVALTNTDNWAVARMAETLGNPFDDTVTVEDVGVNKPDPRMFAYCLGRQSTHGYRKSDIMHVAQSQFHDIGAAVGLGYETCWIERRKGQAGSGATPAATKITRPDHHFSSLEELADAAGL
ncbi:HAD-IA family hydrolase [Spiractinospora alimapuensis]|uniref:HAD-IA family hydrolase n=1 Tax=Spiractinospora alimapuensis TaxID=2820884 RepID=UPI001F3A4882|nr:HAD-IA family hydrolase [Spiractinospora alimapuensis]QVQ50005.1 HAD-IA family hydrolase [Spiractinospora alimapuensis]